VEKACEVKQALAGLVESRIARESNSPFVSASNSSEKLIVGVRAKDGVMRNFRICVEETTEAPTLATSSQSQPQDGAGKEAQADEGCCQGTQTCGEATEASPAQEASSEKCDDTAADANATEAPAAS